MNFVCLFNKINVISWYEKIIATKVRLRAKLSLLINGKKQIVNQEYDVVHFITGDKFINSYIYFMKKYFSIQKHLFVTTRSLWEESYSNIPDVVVCNSFAVAMSRSDILNICKKVEIIIWSGIFDTLALLIVPQWLIRKSFLQFWGGDFYRYREPQNGMFNQLLYSSFLKICDKVKGLIFLINGEEDVFKKICHVKKANCFVAPMPADLKIFDRIKKQKKINHYRISIGNSATQENNHLEIFNKIKHLKLDDIEVCCPLSYGDMEYKEVVKKVGCEYFGHSFRALEDYMDLDDYGQYLADCDVGIFDNNRQQAMGNITMMLMLGKKVYINKHTSMWEHFKSLGCIMYDTEALLDSSIDEIFKISAAVIEVNRKAIISHISAENSVKQWKCVLECAN